MEMLAIYFAIADNISIFQSRVRKRRTLRGGKKVRKIIINIRSDSKSAPVEQLKGICEIRDNMLFRICERIRRLLKILSCNIAFKHMVEGMTDGIGAISRILSGYVLAQPGLAIFTSCPDFFDSVTICRH